jgi:hypothetical protein
VHPYDINEGERPDNFTNRYYEDQFMSWLVYLSNNITDPYYGWYLTEEEFNKTLKKKYGQEVYVLQEKVAYYRNNWYGNESNLNLSAYDTLPVELQRYWEPVYNGNRTPLYYRRVQQDWTTNTNHIMRYRVDGSGFVKNEIVDIVFDENYKGRGQVVLSNTSSLTLQHMSGTLTTNNDVSITVDSYIYGRESNANQQFITVDSSYDGSVIFLANNIAPSENTSWTPVSIYDDERDNNEANRSINVVDKNYSYSIVNALKSTLA